MGEESARTTWWFKLCSNSRGRWKVGSNLCRVLTGLRTPWSNRVLPWSKDRLRRTCRRIRFGAGEQDSPGSHCICRRVTFVGKDPWHDTTLWRVLAAPSTSLFTCREWAIHQWINPPFPSRSSVCLWAEPWAHSDILLDTSPERIWHRLGAFGQWLFGACFACRGGRRIPTQ